MKNCLFDYSKLLKMNLRRLSVPALLISLLFGAGQPLVGQERIDATRKLAAMDSIITLIDSYGSLHNFTEDGTSVSESAIQKFRALFGDDNSIIVIDDLTPGKGRSPEKSPGQTGSQSTASSSTEILSIQDYLSIVRNDYKRGLFATINYELDYQADIFFNNKRNTYYLYVSVQKSLTGMYQLRQVHRYQGEQVLKIEFRSGANQVSDFRIAEIITPRELVKREIRDHWKGFFAGAGGTVNQNHLLYSHPFQDNPAPHIINNPVIRYSIGAVAQYNFGAKAGLQFELNYRNYLVNQSIDTYTTQDNLIRRDIDNDAYNRITEVDSFRSELKMTMLEIPLLLNLRPVVYNHVAWNINLGIRNQIILNASSSPSGSVEYKGYYPDYPVVLYELPEYGFTSNKLAGEETPVGTDKFTLLGSLGTGLEFRISNKILGGIGLRADYSLLKLNLTQSVLSPDYHDLIIPQESRLMVFNVYFNVLYKIF